MSEEIFNKSESFKCEMVDNCDYDEFVDALNCRRFDAIRLLLTSGSINVNDRLRFTDLGYIPTPLIYARGDLSLIELLLECGADINGTNDKGQTACHVAAKAGDWIVLEFLVERGANVALKDHSGMTPLDTAMTSCLSVHRFISSIVAAGAPLDNDRVHFRLATVSTSCIQALLDRGVVVRDLRDSDGNTPLFACQLGDDGTASALAVLDMLVNVCGVDLNARNNAGNTCCHERAVGYQREIFGWFIEAGCDVNAVDNQGLTPLLRAFSSPRLREFVVWLLAAGADVHVRAADGQTAGHFATSHPGDARPIVHVVIAAGAEMESADNHGRTMRQLLDARGIVVDPLAIEAARREIAKVRLDFVRHRALQVCIGLQSRGLDALQMCAILQQACGPLAPVIAFHHWWAIATTVKHFQSKK